MGAHPTSKKLFEPKSYLPTVEEPICVLKIELDGENVEEIKIFENAVALPRLNSVRIVNEFGNKFNLSQNGRDRLLDQIYD